MPNLKCVFFLSLAARWVLTAAAFLKNPVCKSSGYKEYAAQVCLRSMFITYDHPYFTSGLHWFVLQLLSQCLPLIPGMQPKLFCHSEQLSKRIMSCTDSPNRLIYFQQQEYTFRLLNKKKVSKFFVAK